MALTDPSDAMSAPVAWSWLHDNRGWGLAAGRVEAYAATPDRVEIEASGLTVTVDREEFIAGYRYAIWRPIDTAGIAR